MSSLSLGLCFGLFLLSLAPPPWACGFLFKRGSSFPPSPSAPTGGRPIVGVFLSNILGPLPKNTLRQQLCCCYTNETCIGLYTWVLFLYSLIGLHESYIRYSDFTIYMLNVFILLFRGHIINSVTVMSLRRQITNDAEVSKTLKNSCIKNDTLGFKGLKWKSKPAFVLQLCTTIFTH